MLDSNDIICFASNTKIVTKNGEKSISKIQLGEEILSYKQDLGIFNYFKVKHIANSYHKSISRIAFQNKIHIECTHDHPIWVINKGWSSLQPSSTREKYNIEVSQLELGDKCLMHNDMEIAEVKILKLDILYGNYTMYIISGDKHNCFFANRILVHDENLEYLINNKILSEDILIKSF